VPAPPFTIVRALPSAWGICRSLIIIHGLRCPLLTLPHPADGVVPSQPVHPECRRVVVVSAGAHDVSASRTRCFQQRRRSCLWTPEPDPSKRATRERIVNAIGSVWLFAVVGLVVVYQGVESPALRTLIVAGIAMLILLVKGAFIPIGGMSSRFSLGPFGRPRIRGRAQETSRHPGRVSPTGQLLTGPTPLADHPTM